MERPPEDPDARVAATVALIEQRGYCLPAPLLGRVCIGGPLPGPAVASAAHRRPDLAVSGAHVHSLDLDAAGSRRRQAGHPTRSPAYWDVAHEYTSRLVSTCPWIRAVLVGGSLSSGGFDDGDDIDLDLVVDDHTKYLSYLVALGVSLRFSWRRRRAGDKAAALPTPHLPKVVCLNVLWEERQARPFARQDAGMGMELLLARPLWGTSHYRELLAANPGLLAQFPQLADVPDDAVEARPGIRHRLLRLLTRPTWLRWTADLAAYQVVRGLHAYVRWHRRRDAEALRHVARMEEFKRPYGILERP